MSDGTPVAWRVEPLAAHHDRSAFSSGEPALDRYLQRQASQDARKGVANVFVLVGARPQAIAGYYTLSSHAVTLDSLPREIRRKLPRYAHIPATLLGRLARDLTYRGRGVGDILLFDAIQRALAGKSFSASFALVVDAKDEAARIFYEARGFIAFIDRVSRLFLPLESAKRLLR